MSNMKFDLRRLFFGNNCVVNRGITVNSYTFFKSLVKNILLCGMSNMKFDLRRLFWNQLRLKSRDYCIFICIKLYTYIIGHYKPLVRITDLVSHTTYVVCVDFIHKWRDLQFKVNSERQIF